MNKYLLSALFIAAFSGCGTSLPPTADPGRAKAALESALDAWCQGDAVDSLRQRSPAVHFNDELWKSGQRLEKYAVVAETANGTGWRCEVKLTMKSSGTGSVARQVAYQIDTHPAIVIVQQP